MAFLSILLASLLGSVHCAGMCGGFVVYYSEQSQRPWRSHVSYNTGRLVTYLSVGALAGYAGLFVDTTGSLAGISQLAAVLTGVLLIIWALPGLAPAVAGHLQFPALRIMKEGYSRFFKISRSRKNFFLLGASSTLLPCGWLYAHTAIAAGTGNPLSAILVMFFFWLGTLPMMVGIGIGSGSLAQFLKFHSPKLVPLLAFTAGILSLTGHLSVSLPGPLSDGASFSSCH